MRYYANFSANGSDSFMHSITDTNLRRIVRDIRAIANGHRYPGNTCRWRVFDEDLRDVARGYTDRDGKKHRIKNL